MYQNIIILSQPRTGSTLVCDLFNYFSHMRVLQEFFNMKEITVYRYLKETEKKLLSTQFDSYDCASLNASMKQNPLKAFGIVRDIIPSNRILKFHTHEIEDWNLEFLFSDIDTKFILVSRKDKLKQYVSNQLAKLSNKYSSRDPDQENYNSHDLVIDPIEFENFKINSDIHYNKYKRKLHNHNFLELVYEDDLENNLESTLDKIHAWLESNNIIVTRKHYELLYQKQNTRSLKDMIVNYKDITKEI